MSYGKLMADAWRENILYSVLLELTYRCNLDCFFCYNDLSLRGRPMRLDDYRRLLDDLAEMQVMVVSLSGGEPLAHPDFFEIGSAARERGFVVRVKSNGHALRGELAQRLKDEVDPFMVELSLHGATAETHDRQTRVPGSFDRLMGNLQVLRDVGLRFKLNSALTIWNENELEQMWAIADSFGVALQIDPTVTARDDGSIEPHAVAASPGGLRAYVRLQTERAARTKVDLSRPVEDADVGDVGQDKHCGAGSLTAAVDPFGNVYPCVAWRRAVGNVHETSIRKIWNESVALSETRDGTVAAKTMLTAEGGLARYVGFCPGLAVTRTGRPDAIPEEQRERGQILQEAFETDPAETREADSTS